MLQMTIRSIAVHLPPVPSVPENDEYGGVKDFTEWRNVVQATPRFQGRISHIYPQIWVL
jgi:hypothetical protein